MNRIFNFFISHEDIYGVGYIPTFFKKQEKRVDEEKAFNFIRTFIIKHSCNYKALNLIFEVILYCFPQQRKEFLKFWIKYNGDFEIFKRINLDSMTFTAWGSLVPFYERCIDFWDSLLDLFKGNAFLKHKAHVEKNIDYYRKRIIDEQKRNFVDDF